MPLVPAKCSNCGAVLKIDSGLEAAVCEFCKTPFIVEKAINNYTTTLNIENANIQVAGGKSVDEALEDIKKLRAIGDNESAWDKLNELIAENPTEHRAFWQLFLIESVDMKKRFEHPLDRRNAKKAISLAQVAGMNDEAERMQAELDGYAAMLQENRNRFEAAKQQVEAKYTPQISPLEIKLKETEDELSRIESSKLWYKYEGKIYLNLDDRIPYAAGIILFAILIIWQITAYYLDLAGILGAALFAFIFFVVIFIVISIVKSITFKSKNTSVFEASCRKRRARP